MTSYCWPSAVASRVWRARSRSAARRWELNSSPTSSAASSDLTCGRTSSSADARSMNASRSEAGLSIASARMSLITCQRSGVTRRRYRRGLAPSSDREPISTRRPRHWYPAIEEIPVRMDYQSRKYALLNSDIEVDRHLRRINTFLAPRTSDRILEIGCGRGFLTREVQRIAPATIGTDLNIEALANGVTGRLRVMGSRALDFPVAPFDEVYSLPSLYHIPDLTGAFGAMDRVLKPGGRVLLGYPAVPIRGVSVVAIA